MMYTLRYSQHTTNSKDVTGAPQLPVLMKWQLWRAVDSQKSQSIQERTRF